MKQMLQKITIYTHPSLLLRNYQGFQFQPSLNIIFLFILEHSFRNPRIIDNIRRKICKKWNRNVAFK